MQRRTGISVSTFALRPSHLSSDYPSLSLDAPAFCNDHMGDEGQGRQEQHQHQQKAEEGNGLRE
ncbi:hypothetical protein Dda_0946 [Drechslerella dactyloides]|uniref:Uncharacterized protein n=1 Tax=Drechslerella dactyloides TaxID=74499 RepID=A0AAD6J5F3_DREDA|nr:hypothetical protein Dda_0946 [Drechslerella dactyloides]